MRLYRIHPNDAVSWALFPRFEARAVAMLQEYCPQIPVDIYVSSMRARFATTPDLTYFVVGIDDEGTIRAHLVAWVEMAWNKPVVHVNQLAADDGASVRDHRGPLLAGLDEWVDSLNRQYENAGQPARIESGEMWSWHPPAWWERYLRGFKVVETIRYVYRFKVGSAPQRLDVLPKELH